MCLQGGDEEDNYNSCSYSGRDNNTGYLILIAYYLVCREETKKIITIAVPIWEGYCSSAYTVSAYVCFVGRRRRR